MKASWILGAITATVFLLEVAAAVESRNDKQRESRAIPLSEIITTSPQDGLQHIRDVMRKQNNGRDAEVVMQQFYDISRGGSNAFIVDATDLHEALSASFSALNASQSLDTPQAVDQPNPKRGKYWLVVYLGSGPSSPTWWTINRVTVDKGKVVVSYRKSKPRPATRDVRRYYYWIPLDKLIAGAYEIELFDMDKNAITLMRRVDVMPRPEKGNSR